MEVTHARSIMAAILEGCEDESILEELIDTAWKLIRSGGKIKPPRAAPKKDRRIGTSQSIEVNGTVFKSTMAACKFYMMEGEYKTVLKDLSDGVHPEDVFPREPPKPRVRPLIE